MSHISTLFNIVLLITILAIFVRGSHDVQHYTMKDLINKPIQEKMCDPGIMSDKMAVKLDDCYDQYIAKIDKDTKTYDKLCKECEKKEKEFFAKFKNLKKAVNRHHLEGICDGLDPTCFAKYDAMIKELDNKHKAYMDDF
ncbi:unnamed protein product [Oppiella nova]|uniref:Uncharacterized protein n=1 Tax=Oppiella nova TaxID=334625 RepID=A0A7R9ME50_9ACAR|nr:unnamed protein product [Oppiella nova]CAG2175401.1 unnamed protein product [Oppiella nova]